MDELRLYAMTMVVFGALVFTIGSLTGLDLIWVIGGSFVFVGASCVCCSFMNHDDDRTYTFPYAR